MLGLLELWDVWQGKLLKGSEVSPKERSMLQKTELKGAGDLKSILTLDLEIQSLKFAQLVFGLALFQYYLTFLPSLDFGMAMYNLCHYMLKYFDFDFIGNYS